MYDLLILALYATIMTGTTILFGLAAYVLYKKLPNTLYSVGMAIRDESIKEYGLGDLVGGGAEGSAGGRPQEGIVGFLSTPMGQNIVNMIMKKIQGGDKGGGSGIYR